MSTKKTSKKTEEKELKPLNQIEREIIEAVVLVASRERTSYYDVTMLGEELIKRRRGEA